MFVQNNPRPELTLLHVLRLVVSFVISMGAETISPITIEEGMGRGGDINSGSTTLYE